MEHSEVVLHAQVEVVSVEDAPVVVALAAEAVASAEAVDALVAAEAVESSDADVN